MFERILNQLREKVRTRQYVMTVHAEDEMDEDSLTIFDVESVILSGKIESVILADKIVDARKSRIQANGNILSEANRWRVILSLPSLKSARPGNWCLSPCSGNKEKP